MVSVGVGVTSEALSVGSNFDFGRGVRVTERLRQLGMSTVRVRRVRGIGASALLIGAVTFFIGGDILSLTTIPAGRNVSSTTLTLVATRGPEVEVRLPISAINVRCGYRGGPSGVLGVVTSLISCTGRGVNSIRFITVSTAHTRVSFLGRTVGATHSTNTSAIAIYSATTRVVPSRFNTFVGRVNTSNIVYRGGGNLTITGTIVTVGGNVGAIGATISDRVSLRIFTNMVGGYNGGLNIRYSVGCARLGHVVGRVS